MAKKIDDEIAAIEEKLNQAKAKKQKMEAATRAAEAKALRASLDHRKILLGALLASLGLVAAGIVLVNRKPTGPG